MRPDHGGTFEIRLFKTEYKILARQSLISGNGYDETLAYKIIRPKPSLKFPPNLSQSN